MYDIVLKCEETSETAYVQDVEHKEYLKYFDYLKKNKENLIWEDNQRISFVENENINKT